MKKIAQTTGLVDKVEITEEAMRRLIRAYCRESGVRNLQKQIEKVSVHMLVICHAATLSTVQSFLAPFLSF